MSNQVDEELFDRAVAIATAAAARTLEWFQRPGLTVDHKADGSEVTDADRTVEQFVRDQVRSAFPDDTVIGEEAGVTTGGSARRWIVDPIDGTASFVRGVPLYATLLAVFDAQGPAVGVVCCPALGETVAAGRGLGCLHNGASTSVSTVDSVGAACISASAFDGSWWPERQLLAVANSGAKTRTWGDGYGYLLLAAGAIDAMVEPSLNAWDIAPMLTVVPEAGGQITTWTGDAGLIDGAPASGVGWLATNGRIHHELEALLA